MLQVLSTCGQLASVSTLICTLLKLAKSLFEQLRVLIYDVTRRQLDHSAVHTFAVCSTPARAAMLRHGAPGSAILTWMLRSSTSSSWYGDQTNSAFEHQLDRLADLQTYSSWTCSNLACTQAPVNTIILEGTYYFNAKMIGVRAAVLCLLHCKACLVWGT